MLCPPIASETIGIPFRYCPKRFKATLGIETMEKLRLEIYRTDGQFIQTNDVSIICY